MPTSELHDTTAVILAGGLGTRLKSVVPDRQKVVAPVAGRPFIFQLLTQLDDAGVRKVVLCTGYQADQVAITLGKAYRDIRLEYSAEPSPLGTAGALRNALPLLDSDPVLVLNGDSYCEVDLPDLFKIHQGPATLVVREVEDTTQSGRVDFDESGKIISFIEKGAISGPGWINAGIYLLGRDLLKSIPAGGAVSLERDIFPTRIGYGLRAFRTRGRFLDIGTPDSYSRAQKVFI
ncbi:MAG: nucleotidyltransferase family protein [bacterium]